MTLFGLDISNHQSRDGFDVAAARAEGFEFLTHKMSEGDGYLDPFFAGVYQQARVHFPGRFGGYVFCRVDASADDEADTVVRAAERAGARPGDFALQIDYEDTNTHGSGYDLMARVRAHVARGWHLLPIYIPRWYWDGYMGRPDLSALPVGLWNSHYVVGAGYASDLYPGDEHAGWVPFGGRPVEILQFTETARAAGEYPIDANAFRGTAAELDTMFGGTAMPDNLAQAILEQEMGEGSAPGNATGWPARRYHLPPDQQPRFSQTDYLREHDAKLCSELPLFGDEPNPRPKPPEMGDDLWGHVLSARAEGLQTQEMLLALAREVGGPELVKKMESIRGVTR